jgi:hypothetical protein
MMANKLPDDVKKRAEAKCADRPHLEIQDPGTVWISPSGKVFVQCDHKPIMRRKQLDFVSTGDGDETGKLGVNLHAVNAGSRALAGELDATPCERELERCIKSFAPLSLNLLKIEPHLSKCGGFLRVHSGRQIGFL